MDIDKIQFKFNVLSASKHELLQIYLCNDLTVILVDLSNCLFQMNKTGYILYRKTATLSQTVEN